MDQGMNQPTQPMPPMQPMEHDSSMKMWWIVGAVVVLALAGWYFYGGKVPTESVGTSAAEQVTIPAPSSGDTTADISADLAQTPDTSAALDADAAASAQAVSSL